MAVLSNTNLDTHAVIRGQSNAVLSGKTPSTTAITAGSLDGTNNNQALGPEFAQVPSRAVLDVTRGVDLFGRFATNVAGNTIERNAGSTLQQWYRYLDLPGAQQTYAINGTQDSTETGLGEGFVEGSAGVPVVRQRERVTVRTLQRGHYMIHTDRAIKETIHNLNSLDMQALMVDYRQVMDKIYQFALMKYKAGTGDLNNTYTNTVKPTTLERATSPTVAQNAQAGFNQVDNGTGNTKWNVGSASIRQGSGGTSFGYRSAVETLIKNNVGKMLPAIYASDRVSTEGMQPTYIALCGETTKFQLENDATNCPDFLPIEKYGDPRAALPEEFGRTKELRWFYSTRIDSFSVSNKTGSGTSNVFPVFIFGANAFTKVTVGGQDMQIMVRPYDVPDSFDPLGQRGFMGWKVNCGATILNSDYLVMLFHAG